MVFGIRFFTELSWKKLGFCVIIPNNIRMQVGVAELADALALGASGFNPCGFDSHSQHHVEKVKLEKPKSFAQIMHMHNLGERQD